MLLLPFFCSAQLNESFSDGDFSSNPVWTGTNSNFIVNTSFQLQSHAAVTSTSYLFTPSEAFDNAVWECWVKINYTTSASNYAEVYIASDQNNLSSGCNGYYVQIGGTNDEVSLFVQTGTTKTKIIDGTDKRTDGNPIEIKIKVTRDTLGNFCLYSKLPTETDYVLEGKSQNNVIKQSSYFGLLYSNTSLTGSDYFFDDILVTGEKAHDKEAPVWNKAFIIEPNKLQLDFSEAMDFSGASFEVDNGTGIPTSQNVSENYSSIKLQFSDNFERGILYTIQANGLKDLAGNELKLTTKTFGIVEPIENGDLVFNEVMFENPANSLEYIELYNNSDKLLDVSNLVFTTRKSDGSLNTGNKIPSTTLLKAQGYLDLCSDADSVRTYHNCPPEATIITTGWSALNNESATLVLANSKKDTIYDELTYNVKWHHLLIKNPKGVALEKISPSLPTQDPDSWHSAASEVNYGTPGYKNSQFREIDTQNPAAKTVWVEPEAFSPDNDGIDDVCFIRYKTEANGFIANVFILNAVGIRIIQLASNILLPTEGFLVWDGHTSGGKNANVGIYVLYFEMFNPETGAKKQLKLPIVVSSR